MWARTLCPLSSSTLKKAFGSDSTTVPSISMAPSFLGMSSALRCLSRCRGRGHGLLGLARLLVTFVLVLIVRRHGHCWSCRDPCGHRVRLPPMPGSWFRNPPDTGGPARCLPSRCKLTLHAGWQLMGRSKVYATLADNANPGHTDRKSTRLNSSHLVI